jgi:hypothetical protein
VSTSVFPFRADANSFTANDPGSGKLKWNNSNQVAATSLYVDVLTSDGFDVTTLFTMMNPPSEFILQSKNLSQNSQTWRMTAPVILYPDWFEVPVALVSTGAQPTFSHNEYISVLLIAEGTPGPEGPQGVPGPAIPFRTGHTWGLVGDVTLVNSLPSLFVPVITGQSTKVVGVRTRLKSGTSVSLSLKRNGTQFLSVTVTVTPATTNLPTPLTLSDDDEITIDLTAHTGVPSDLSVTLFLEHLPGPTI